MSLFDDEAMDNLEAQGHAGPATHAHCDQVPSDVIVTRRIAEANSAEARVAIAIQEDGRGSLSVVLTPGVARAFAAALLNAADSCDGTVPLSFHPATPDGVDPFHP